MTLRTLALHGFAAAYFCVGLCGCGTSPDFPKTAIPGPSTSYAAVRPNDVSVTPFSAPASVFPGEVYTAPTGIRKQWISATIELSSGGTIGGMYDRSTGAWMPVAVPQAKSTAAYGPESIPNGFRVVGSYKNSGQHGDSGFVYDSVSNAFTPIVAPPYLCAPKSCNFTIAHSVFQKGSNYLVVGNYDAASKVPQAVAGHAFIYDSAKATFATIDIPRSISTTAYGIWIDKETVAVAGGYADEKGQHAYVRDLTGKQLLTYDYPNARITHFEGISGAGGPGNYNVVGDYSKPRSAAVYGFFQEIRGWKACTPVVIGRLSGNSVSQRTVVGVYSLSGSPSGYIATVPPKYRCKNA
jgi:subtilase-type serine protease